MSSRVGTWPVFQFAGSLHFALLAPMKLSVHGDAALLVAGSVATAISASIATTIPVVQLPCGGSRPGPVAPARRVVAVWASLLIVCSLTRLVVLVCSSLQRGATVACAYGVLFGHCAADGATGSAGRGACGMARPLALLRCFGVRCLSIGTDQPIKRHGSNRGGTPPLGT